MNSDLKHLIEQSIVLKSLNGSSNGFVIELDVTKTVDLVQKERPDLDREYIVNVLKDSLSKLNGVELI